MALIMIRKINTPALLEGDLFYSDVLAEKKKKLHCTIIYYCLIQIFQNIMFVYHDVI